MIRLATLPLCLLLACGGNEVTSPSTPRPPAPAPVTDQPVSVAVCQDGDRVVRRIEQIERTPQVATVLTTYSGPIDSPRGDAPSFALSEQRSISELAQGIFKEAH